MQVMRMQEQRIGPCLAEGGWCTGASSAESLGVPPPQRANLNLNLQQHTPGASTCRRSCRPCAQWSPRELVTKYSPAHPAGTATRSGDACGSAPTRLPPLKLHAASRCTHTSVNCGWYANTCARGAARQRQARPHAGRR